MDRWIRDRKYLWWFSIRRAVYSYFSCAQFGGVLFSLAFAFINVSNKCMLLTLKCRYMIHNLYLTFAGCFFSFSFFVVFGICFFFFACKFHDWMIQEQVFFVLLSSMMSVHVQNRFASSSTHIIVVNFSTRLLLFHFTEYSKVFSVVCGHHRGFFSSISVNFFFFSSSHIV